MLVAVAVAAALVATEAFAADVKSVSRLAFGPDNILLLPTGKAPGACAGVAGARAQAG